MLDFILRTVFLISVLKSVLTNQCQSGWTMYGESCYQTSTVAEVLTFMEAADVCRSKNASLADIESPHEHKFLSTLVWNTHSTHDFWIGLNDKFVEGDWRWYDSNSKPGVLFWCQAEPNNANQGEDCVLMHRNHGFCWNDDSCNTHHNFICKKRVQAESTTNPFTPTGQYMWRTLLG